MHQPRLLPANGLLNQRLLLCVCMTNRVIALASLAGFLSALPGLAQMGDGIHTSPSFGTPYSNSVRYQDANGNSYRITPTQSGQYRIQNLGPSYSPMAPSYGSVIPRNY
jgi:hypothetical protein